MTVKSPLFRFLAFYSVLFAAFGVASPFLPSLLQQNGLGSGELGVVLACGTAIRIFAGPLGGRLADRIGRPAVVLAVFTAAAGVVGIGYAPARGLPLLLIISIAHAAMLAPLTPIADALALGSAQIEPRFEYGWVRAAGSAAFIAGSLVSGQTIDWAGLDVIIWLNVSLLALAACSALFVPNVLAGTPSLQGPSPTRVSAWTILRIPAFRRLMIVAALIGGSHALHDGFEVIRWRAAGLSASQSSLLWAMAVAAEVIIFLFIGRGALERLGPARAMTLSAVAGIVRWSAAAQTAWFPIMALVEPLHGLTFALLHLACMDMMRRVVPVHLAATAQAFYSTVALGATSAAVTLAGGPLYAALGASAFWAMTAMCVIALPLASRVQKQPPSSATSEHR